MVAVLTFQNLIEYQIGERRYIKTDRKLYLYKRYTLESAQRMLYQLRREYIESCVRKLKKDKARTQVRKLNKKISRL